MTKKPQISGAILLIMLLWHLLGGAFFMHRHLIEGHILVHSHPYSGTSENPGHDHTSGQLVILEQVRTAVDTADTFAVQEPSPLCRTVPYQLSDPATPAARVIADNFLRGPPVL